MEKLSFKTTINASPERVWEALWSDASYREWTAEFAPGSRAETDWQEGSRVLFTDGKGEGMVAEIARSRPGQYMSFRHLGMIKDGVEDLDSPAVKAWAGAMENYTLTQLDGKTELTIDMDITADHKEYFEKAWPKALDTLKTLAEERTAVSN